MKPLGPSARSPLLAEPVEASLADGLAVGGEVRWILAGAGGPAIGYGAVVACGPGTIEVKLDGMPPFDAGARLIVEAEGGAQRWIVTVTRVSGRSVTARLASAPAPERREYPRLQGELAVRYAVSAGAPDAAAWMRGGPLASPARVPAPRMEFSVTGLAFEDAPLPPGADRLLLELGLVSGRRRWRCVARVVHVSALPEARAPGATHRIGVAFEQIPEEATRALVRYTLRLQTALMEGGEP